MEKGKTIEGFEDLVVWQQAIDLAADVYHLFEPSRDFTLKNQIQRAAISISSNIAEGYERGSNREFVQFLYYAKASCGEVRSQVQLAKRVKVISESQAAQIFAASKELSARLGAYINVRNTRFN
ncbi:MAG TPA: four helix bundle protein [Opitutaceae bacterium]|nr:four helix bundle protein [Opitutaceae bacterium]HND62649.1 four helix bundle protein [Opitutaceae bacterium]